MKMHHVALLANRLRQASGFALRINVKSIVVRLQGESLNTFAETPTDWEAQLKGFEFDVKSDAEVEDSQASEASGIAEPSPEVGQ